MVVRSVNLLAFLALTGCSAFSAGLSEDVPNPDLNDDAGAVADAFGIRDTGANDTGATLNAKGNMLCGATKDTCFPDNEAPSECGSGDAGEDSGDAGGGGACRVMGTAPMCGMVSRYPKGENESCTSASDCAPGFDCVGSPPACRHYCCDKGTCATYGKEQNKQFFCDTQKLNTNNNQFVPVCQAVMPCNLAHTLQGNDDCGANLQCAIVEVANQLTTSCVAVGNVAAGGDCSADHCDSKLQCVGSPATCHQLCDPKMPTCPMGETCFHQWPVLDSQGVGVCQ
jgi:hypothetical protein